MTGPEHYREAEELLGSLSHIKRGDGADTSTIAEAQVHATLALVAATALANAGEQAPTVDLMAWADVASLAARIKP